MQSFEYGIECLPLIILPLIILSFLNKPAPADLYFTADANQQTVMYPP